MTEPRAAKTRRRTRIQRENEERILSAALEVFSTHGFRGATLDMIADGAGMSKPNLLYYFRGKDDIFTALLEQLLTNWLDPLHELSAAGDPMREIRGYVRRKLALARERPRESRLFANEIMQGAPRIAAVLRGELKELVDDKASVIRAWIAQGKIRKVDPYHLIFSIWATTQHYADFDVQVRMVLNLSEDADGHFDDAARFLEELFTRGLAPDAAPAPAPAPAKPDAG
ncbi:MAG: TetR/AcrR family transcriptional regulator [Paracoccaceae bacterium]|jgi:TetR/AcrR family transcriptional regulator